MIGPERCSGASVIAIGSHAPNIHGDNDVFFFETLDRHLPTIADKRMGHKRLLQKLLANSTASQRAGIRLKHCRESVL